MGNSSLHTLGLCAGVGMLDLGVEIACGFHGIDVRTVAYAEREASAAATLLARMEDESLEPAPLWIDSLECLPREPLRGRVDAVVAGFPCPDFSVAGKQEGTKGERYLLPAILEIARDVEARWLFLENVRGIFSAENGAAFDEIQRTLADFGWSAEWTTLRASEVGASHQRERWFCVAYRDGAESLMPEREQETRRIGGFTDERGKMGHAQSLPCGQGRAESAGQRGPTAVDQSGSELGNATGDDERRGLEDSEIERRQCRGLADQQAEPGETIRDVERAGQVPADARSGIERQDNGAGEPELIGEGCSLFAPGPSDFDGWARVVEDGSIDFLAAATQPSVRVLVDGWPWWWTRPEPISFARREMELFRSRLEWHLRNCLGGFCDE